MEGAEIDPADLAPKLIYPAAIRRPDGSLASGAQWFQAAYKDRFPTPQGEAREFRRIPQADWQDLIASGEAPDPRPYLNWILDQDGVGSCAAEGLGGADDLRRRMFHGAPSGQPQATAPNPWFAYHTTSGGYDGGSSLEDNLAFYQRWGCARQAVWPRSKGWRAKPSEEAYADAAHYKLIEVAAFPVTDVELFGTFLLLGVPVYTGFERPRLVRHLARQHVQTDLGQFLVRGLGPVRHGDLELLQPPLRLLRRADAQPLDPSLHVRSFERMNALLVIAAAWAAASDVVRAATGEIEVYETLSGRDLFLEPERPLVEQELQSGYVLGACNCAMCVGLRARSSTVQINAPTPLSRTGGRTAGGGHRARGRCVRSWLGRRPRGDPSRSGVWGPGGGPGSTAGGRGAGSGQRPPQRRGRPNALLRGR